MLQHIVLFKFPEPVVDDTFVAMTEFISTWSEEIPDLRAIRFGKSRLPDLADGYQYLLYLEFDDADAVTRYMSDPTHLAMGRWAAGQGCKFLVFNYAVDATTSFV